MQKMGDLDLGVSKNRGKTPQIIHFFGGFSMIFTIHFGGKIPLFLETPICLFWTGCLPGLLKHSNRYQGGTHADFREAYPVVWVTSVLGSPWSTLSASN